MSHIQISNTLLVIAGMWSSHFIAVLMLHKSRCSSAMGSALYWVSTDVHGPRYGWSMCQASAMLLVPKTEPFGSQALCNLDPSHLLGDAMHLN